MTKINTYKNKKYRLKTRKYKMKTRKYKLKTRKYKKGGTLGKVGNSVTGVSTSTANLGIAALNGLSTLVDTGAAAIVNTTQIVSVATDDTLRVARGMTETIGVLGDAIEVANLSATVALSLVNKTLSMFQKSLISQASTVSELYKRYDTEQTKGQIPIRTAYINYLDKNFYGLLKISKERTETLKKKNYADERIAYSYMKQLGCTGFRYAGLVSCGFSVKPNQVLPKVTIGGTNSTLYTGTQVKNIYEKIKNLNRVFLTYVQTMDVKMKISYNDAKQQIETILPEQTSQKRVNAGLLEVIVKFMESNSISIYVGNPGDKENTTFLGHEKMVNDELGQLVTIRKQQKINEEKKKKKKKKKKPQ